MRNVGVGDGGTGMEPNEAALFDIIEKIYAAAADPDQWQAAVDAFCGQYADGRGTMLHHDLRLGHGSFPVTSSAWERNWVDAYNRYFASVNPWLRNLKKRPVGLATPAEFMLGRAELLKTEFYTDYMRPQGLSSGVGVTIHQDNDRFIAVSVIYPERTAQNESANVALLQRLAPHFRRALQVNHRLANTRVAGAASEAALDRLAVGFVMVDATGRVVFQNKAATEMLAANDGIGLDRMGTVTIQSAAENAWLRQAIAQAAMVLDAAEGHTGPTMKLRRPSGKQPYSILVTPLRPGDRGPGSAGCCAAILITDADHSRLPPATALVNLFGVTNAEARLLRLLIAGCSIAHASKALGISPFTARTHVKNMFVKMNCTRQSDLIRTVIEHPAWLLTSRSRS